MPLCARVQAHATAADSVRCGHPALPQTACAAAIRHCRRQRALRPSGTAADSVRCGHPALPQTACAAAMRICRGACGVSRLRCTATFTSWMSVRGTCCETVHRPITASLPMIRPSRMRIPSRPRSPGWGGTDESIGRGRLALDSHSRRNDASWQHASAIQAVTVRLGGASLSLAADECHDRTETHLVRSGTCVGGGLRLSGAVTEHGHQHTQDQRQDGQGDHRAEDQLEARRHFGLLVGRLDVFAPRFRSRLSPAARTFGSHILVYCPDGTLVRGPCR